jgi:FtsP/CotA-like multicopper oxidase with cupredoxin domain
MRRVVGTLLGLVLLGGCAAVPQAPGTTSAAPQASVTTPSAARPSGASASSATQASGTATPAPTSSLRITLAGGKADPNGERLALAKGTTLVLTVTSDHADEVHVHGYDVEIAVGAGETVTRKVVLDQVGRFEVESHEPALTILQLTVS